MIFAQITGTNALVARLGSMPDRVRERVGAEVQNQAELTRQEALDRMASLFKNAGGRMRDTLSTSYNDGGAVMTGTVSASGLPYLAIQEFGGVTRPHDIFPVRANALAFAMPGKAVFKAGSEAGNMVFAKAVHHPGSKMPERSYLRSALATRRAEIIAALRSAATETSE